MSYQATSAFVLAGVYAVSALQKGRDLRPFQDYLRPLAGRFSGIAARSVVCTEVMILVALLLSVADEDLAWAASISSIVFLTLAALSYSALIASGQTTECHCFGRLPTSGRIDPAIRPALLALRTSILITLSVTVSRANPRASAGVSVAIVAALSLGLLFAIGRERLRLKGKTHPRVQELAGQIARLQAHTWWVNGHPRSW